MTTEKRVRQKYTENFKRDAVALVTEQGYKLSEAAHNFGINANFWINSGNDLKQNHLVWC